MGREQVERALREVTGYVNGVEQAEAAENARLLAEEREDAEPDFPCLDIVWQGIFAEVADIVKERSWGVWLATYSALGAIAHCNLKSFFYRPVYGMTYSLLISKTGTGKGFYVDIVESLLPPDYQASTGVQSGEGLLGIISEEVPTDDKRDKPTYRAVPSILLLPEWSALAKAVAIENSRLMEMLNGIFQQEKPFTLARSNRNTGGAGGRIFLTDPKLSIFGSTTIKSIVRVLEKHPDIVSQGLFNRFLVLPGPMRKWIDYERDRAVLDQASLRLCTQHLYAHAWQPQGSVWDLYDEGALEVRKQWGVEVAEPLMNSEDDTPVRDSLARLHFYSHHIALMYTWSSRRQRIAEDFVAAALAIVNTAKRFVSSLLVGGLLEDLPQGKRFSVSLQEKILTKVRNVPGVSSRIIQQDLRRAAPLVDIRLAVGHLVSSGLLRSEKEKLYLNKN